MPAEIVAVVCAGREAGHCRAVVIIGLSACVIFCCAVSFCSSLDGGNGSDHHSHYRFRRCIFRDIPKIFFWKYISELNLIIQMEYDSKTNELYVNGIHPKMNVRILKIFFTFHFSQDALINLTLKNSLYFFYSI